MHKLVRFITCLPSLVCLSIQPVLRYKTDMTLNATGHKTDMTRKATRCTMIGFLDGLMIFGRFWRWLADFLGIHAANVNRDGIQVMNVGG